MKKIIAAVTTVTAALVLTGCAPQLSASDACSELRAIVASAGNLPSGAGDEAKKVGKQLQDLAGKSPDSLKDSIRAFADYRIEDAKGGDADENRLSDLRPKMQNAGEVLKSACNF